MTRESSDDSVQRWPAARGRRSYESPVLIGRQEEARLIEETLLAALSAEGALLSVAGEAGIGKSRLARHAQRRAGQLGAGVIVGHCDEGSTVPYLPFVEGIGNHLLQLGVRTVRRRLGPMAAELTDLFPQLEPRHRRPAGEDPLRSKLRLFEAISALLRVLAEDHNFLTLVIEDLQWADASSLELLSFLLRRLEADPLVLLVTIRTAGGVLPERLSPLVDGWRRLEKSRLVSLKALERDEVGALAAAILGVAEVQPEVVDRLHYLSEGSPLVVEDLIWESALAQPGGDVQVLALRGVGVPTSYADRVGNLLRRLEPLEVQVLQAAAVLSPPLSVDVLAQITNATTRDVAAALRAAGVLQLVEADGLGRFNFRHHLVREAIYASEPESLRRELHGLAARALETDMSSAAFEIARHLLAADAAADAVPACLLAAEQATKRRGYEEAARLYAWALQHVTDPLERGRVLTLLGEASYASAAHQSAVAHLEEAVALLDASSYAREAARARLILGTCHYQAGRGEQAREQFQRVIADLRELGPSEELADAYVRLSSLHVFQLDVARARELAEAGLATARQADSVAQEAWARCFLGVAMVVEGDIDGGLEALDGSYEIAAANDFDWIAMNAVFNGLTARLDNLRAGECPLWLKRLRELPGSYLREPFAADVEARMLLELGRVEASLRAARSAHDLATASGTKTVAAWSQRRMALALAEAGSVEQAVALLGDGEAPSERQELLFDRLVRIRVELAAGDVAQAAAVAAELLDESSWRQRDAVLIAAAVEALVASGRVESAERLLDSAGTGGIEEGNPYLEQARGRLALGLGLHREGAEHARAAGLEFKRLGYRLEELRSRLLEAELKAAAGEVFGTAGDLEHLIAEAGACGAAMLTRAARRLAASLGAEVVASGNAPLLQPQADDSRLSLISRLPHALRDNEFVLNFQPEVELASGQTVAYEALVRWRRPGGSILLPERFIPVAEQAGLINELTGWVLDNALSQAAGWAQLGVPTAVAVNVSVHDLERPTFVNRVSAALAANRADPKLLCLEVTETSAMRALNTVVGSMERLRALGVRLSIDDFGTGQSSLAYLRHLPVDEVKLDRSFCADLSDSARAIVRSVVTMAHELGLRVVAEGIEDQGVLDALLQLGCDIGQGYLFGAPALAEDIGNLGTAAV